MPWCWLDQVSCGLRHAVALSISGRVYTWGEASYGQLGHDDTLARNVPTWVSSLQLRKIVQVCASARSTSVLTDFNEVIAWGMTSSVLAAGGGDATVDPFFQSTSPLEVPFHSIPGRSIKRLISGFSHAMSLTGALFAQSDVRPWQGCTWLGCKDLVVV